MSFSPEFEKEIRNALEDMGQLMEGFEVGIAWNMHSKCVDIFNNKF